MQVLFVIDEATPVYKLGGLGDVGGSLPLALNRAGVDIRLAMPYHPEIKVKKPIKEAAFDLPYGKLNLKVESFLSALPNSSVPLYLFSEPKYINQTTDAFDKDVEKFTVFSLAVTHWLSNYSDFWQPQIIHCHDWHTGMVPVLIKHAKEHRYKTIFTIHNAGYQGKTDLPIAEYCHISPADCDVLSWDLNDSHTNLLMQGVIHTDYVTTVSPTYASEITTPDYGAGLDPVFSARKDKLVGIINGIDTQFFNPETDPFLTYRYTTANAKENKLKNRQELCQVMGLNPDLPMVGFIGRVDPQQKGIGFILEYLHQKADLPEHNFVFLGVGDPTAERALHTASKNQSTVKIITRFDEPLAHQIYAASQLLLIPSSYEPCGLIQLIAMRYGTLPIAHQTGGLADTIKPNETGWLFKPLTTQNLLNNLSDALKLIQDPNNYPTWVSRAMAYDCSWTNPAQNYLSLYHQILDNSHEIK